MSQSTLNPLCFSGTPYCKQGHPVGCRRSGDIINLCVLCVGDLGGMEYPHYNGGPEDLPRKVF